MQKWKLSQRSPAKVKGKKSKHCKCDAEKTAKPSTSTESDQEKHDKGAEKPENQATPAQDSDREKHNKGKKSSKDSEKQAAKASDAEKQVSDNDGAKDTEQDSSPNLGEEESNSGSDSGGSKEQSSNQSDDTKRHAEDAEAVASLVAVMDMGQAAQGDEKDDAKTQDDWESMGAANVSEPSQEELESDQAVHSPCPKEYR